MAPLSPDADFVLYQQYHDEEAFGGIEDLLSKDAPRIKKLVDAVAARPNVKAYFESDRLVIVMCY